MMPDVRARAISDAAEKNQVKYRFLPVRENFSSRAGSSIRFLVVHDTGNPAPTADAYRHYLYFNGGNRRSSAHFFVDDREIIQIISTEYAAWHVGDGRGRYGITNRNSVGIELCIAEGSDLEQTKANALLLLRILLREFGLPKSAVVRHFDASRKICPRSMSANGWALWKRFWREI